VRARTARKAISYQSEGGTNGFRVRLAAQPAADVTVAVARASGDTNITVQSGTNLVFAADTWSAWQAVTLAAAEDADASNGTAVITCASAGLSDVLVTATESDNDITHVVAMGGTVTNYPLNGTNFTAHIFTTVGTTNLSVTSPGNVEVLVVAGGGGGGIVIIRYVSGGGVVAPAAPTGLTATAAGTNRIELAWTDNASNETGYVVNRSLDSNAWAFVTLTAVNATNHNDTGLATNTLYYYRVAASNAAGLSAYAYASATTWTDYEAWRRDHFTTAEPADPDISGDDADPDQDRFSNLREYLAGTNPNDDTSYLGFTTLGDNRSEANEFLVYWQSATGRLYTLRAATNLINGFNLILGTNIQATPPENVHTDHVTGVEQKFYRVMVGE